MTNEDLVKVRLRYGPAENLPAGEWLAAKPIDAHDGGGTYELHNTSFFVPLAAGDLVRAELDGDGGLQVVELLGACDHLLTVVDIRRPDADIRAICDSWLSHGALWTEGTNGVMCTIWRGGTTALDVATVLAPDLESGWLHWLSTATPQDRVLANMDDLVLELDRRVHLPPTNTDYWVGDDPYWRAEGLADPDLLAFVQRVAGEDPEIARALEKGEHEKALAYLGIRAPS